MVAFVFEGTLALCFKAILELNLSNSQNMFILLYSFFAMSFSILTLLKIKTVPNKKELAIGALAALASTGNSIFWVRGLLSIAAIIFFPVATASGIILITVASYLIWKERTSWGQRIGIAAAIAAIVLIAL